MHASLNFLPELLRNHLGAFSRLDLLESLPSLMASGLKVTDLRRSHSAQPYHVDLPGQGLSLMLQSMNPQAPVEEQTWGLQGITFKVGEWQGDWPIGLNPQTATATDLITLLAEEPDMVMNMAPMVCLGMTGTAGQIWGVTAVFDRPGGTLGSLVLSRVGEWRALNLPVGATEVA